MYRYNGEEFDLHGLRVYFPNTCFPESGPDSEWLLENNVEEFIAITNPAIIEAERVASLWKAAHDKEYNEISGSAVGMLVLGVLQNKPKCMAVEAWIKSIWDEYYIRKANGSTDLNFNFAGNIPYSVPELMAELGL